MSELREIVKDEEAWRAAVRRVTIYSLDVFLSLFGTSLLFHVQF